MNEIKSIETREIKSSLGTSKFRKTRKPEWLKKITVRPGKRIVVIPGDTQEQKVLIGYFCIREETCVCFCTLFFWIYFTMFSRGRVAGPNLELLFCPNRWIFRLSRLSIANGESAVN